MFIKGKNENKETEEGVEETKEKTLKEEEEDE